MENIFFGIRIASYRRQNGSYHLLHRCLKSILSQTYDKWKVFLIGDDYQPHSEFEELASIIPNDKLYYFNLPNSPERSKYSGNDLWKVSGYTASCFGLKKIQEEGLIVANLDDDDFFLPNHLELLASAYKNFPEAVFVYTKSTHKNGLMPEENMELFYNNRSPRAYSLIHSATSWDTKRMPLMYVNIIDNPSGHVAGDARMWDEVNDYCHKHNLKTLYVSELTVRHDYEQSDQPIEPLLL